MHLLALTNSLLSTRKRVVLLAMLTAAMAINVAFLAMYHIPAPKRLVGDEIYYFNLGSAIANRQPVQHDPLWPPLYGELVGAVFTAAGVCVFAVQVAQIGLWLLSGYFLYQIVRQLLGEPLVALVALGLYLFSPELIVFSHYLWPETLHLFLMWGALWLLICHGQRAWTAAIAGVLLGLAILTKSLLLPLLPVVLLFVLLGKLGSPSRQRRALHVLLLAAAGMVTVIVTTAVAPTERGERALAGSATFNTWVGLNDAARVDTQDVIVGQAHQEFLAAGSDLAARNAVYGQKIRDLLRDQGILPTLAHQATRQYFRLFNFETFLTTQLPGGPRAAYAFDAPLLVTALRLYSVVFYALVLAAGAAGIALMRGRPLNWWHFFLVFLIYNLAIYLFLHVTTRYMIQLLPVWIAFAAVALTSGAVWMVSGQPLTVPGFSVSRMRAVAGALLAISVLLLSFASLFSRP